jgi:hypothetical protein
MAKTGYVTLYCRNCQTRIFTSSDLGHDLMRRWTKLLDHNEPLRRAIMEELAALE